MHVRVFLRKRHQRGVLLPEGWGWLSWRRVTSQDVSSYCVHAASHHSGLYPTGAELSVSLSGDVSARGTFLSA